MRKSRLIILIATLAALLSAATFAGLRYWNRRHAFAPIIHSALAPIPTEHYSPFQTAVLKELDRQVKANIRYQDGYFTAGEPPANIGVCTDVVIRSFRAAGVDLQKEVGDDIRK